jgi:hypothetical protein
MCASDFAVLHNG